ELYDFPNPVFYDIPNWQTDDNLDDKMSVYGPDAVNSRISMTNPQYTLTKSIKNGDFYDVNTPNTINSRLTSHTNDVFDDAIINSPEKYPSLKIITMSDAIQITDSSLNIPTLYENDIDAMNNSILTRF
ncbi:unnamed protein product, partial [Heterobilharzia americana]